MGNCRSLGDKNGDCEAETKADEAGEKFVGELYRDESDKFGGNGDEAVGGEIDEFLGWKSENLTVNGFNLGLVLEGEQI